MVLLGAMHAVMHASEFSGLHGLVLLLRRSVMPTIGKVTVTNRRLYPTRSVRPLSTSKASLKTVKAQPKLVELL